MPFLATTPLEIQKPFMDAQAAQSRLTSAASALDAANIAQAAAQSAFTSAKGAASSTLTAADQQFDAYAAKTMSDTQSRLAAERAACDAVVSEPIVPPTPAPVVPVDPIPPAVDPAPAVDPNATPAT